MKFGDKLSQLRRKAGLSQEELGDKLNVTRQTISKWELGQSKPDTDKLMEISKLLNVDFNQLVDDELIIEDGTTDNDIGNDEVRPRKWLLIVLIIVAIGIVIALANKYVTDKKAEEKNNKGIFGIFSDIFGDSFDVLENFEIHDNQLYEQYAGTKDGFLVEGLLDHIITNNKKNKNNVITVIFEEINSSDPTEIKDIKRNLDYFTNYEVSLDYDENGYVNMVTIETIIEEETVSQFDIITFNNIYENLYSGTTNGKLINDMLDKIITNNKTKLERIIRVVYGSVNTTDENEIRNLKKSFGDVWTDYEVILDYDEVGFVNQVRIEN